MTKKLARLLRADIQETSDLKSIAKTLANKGRGGDTILAHITPKEVKILKAAGGAGTVNPETGLMEFYDGDYYIPESYSYGADYGAQQPVAPPVSDVYPEEFQRGTAADVVSPEAQAAQQYAGSAFPYPDASPSAINSQGQDMSVNQYIAGNEFPLGMSSRPDLLAAQREAQAGAEFPPGMASAINPEAAKAIASQQAAAPSAGPQPSALQKYVIDPYKALKDATGLTGTDLLRVGGAGAGAVLGRQQAKKAAEQIQQSTQEQKNLGAPYQQTGQELQRAAMSGELTPQGAQAYQAMRAQMAQGVESRGGVGVAQAQAQTEAFRQQLLANQYNLGLQVSQIGDNIALGAIRTGMQLDQQLNQANQQFYTQLAAIAGGGTYGYQAPRTTGAQP
jgi:hypothetical protein